MKDVVYILHGLGADSHANWFPWLKQELKSKGYTVAVPDFPCASIPKLEEWLDVLKSTIGQYGEGILVGHSLGGLLAIQYLLAGGKSSKVLLVATPFRKMEFAPEIDGFFPDPKDLPNLKGQSEFIVLQSKDDSLVYPSEAKKWVQILGGKLVVLSGLGHMDVAELPEILECFD